MPKRILLADDSITIQKVVELTFSDGDYEVVAVNNGARALEQIEQSRPDIILSDIIMPEKNGYEVCEFIKSHPDYRTIPVILLTGTFEPFDPDRAEKAGCDAVVTKPFESQSLVNKVEELIERAHSEAPSEPEATTPPAAAGEEPDAFEMAAPAPGFDQQPAEEPSAASDAFSLDEGGGQPSVSPPPEPHGDDIFAASHDDTPPADLPFDDSPADAGETRAFPAMDFGSFDQAPAATGAPESAPDATAAPAVPSQTDAFDDGSSFASASEPDKSESPFGSEENEAIPRIEVDDDPFGAANASSTAPAEPTAGQGGWDSPPESDQPADAPFSDQDESMAGETRAFPSMDFESLQRMQQEADAADAGSGSASFDEASESDWSERPTESGLDSAAPAASGGGDEFGFSEPSPEPSASADDVFGSSEQPEDSTVGAPQESEPSFSAGESSFGDASFDEPAVPSDEAPAESPFEDVSHAEPAEPESEEPAAAATAPAEAMPAAGSLTEEQIDRIARRVVELMSEELVRNIAWEVVPDMAEIVVKERIRQLEAEVE